MLWDTAIAKAYCGSAWRRRAAASYGRFMSISAEQARTCEGGRDRFGQDLPKAIDERNYCVLTHTSGSTPPDGPALSRRATQLGLVDPAIIK